MLDDDDNGSNNRHQKQIKKLSERKKHTHTHIYNGKVIVIVYLNFKYFLVASVFYIVKVSQRTTRRRRR